MITDTQSYSLVIRDVFFDALLDVPFFTGFTKRKSKYYQTQPQDIPFLGVYILDEQMGPDGDPNAGHIRFLHTLRIGFSVVVQNNDPVASELICDQAFWAIMQRLWTDQYIMNMLDTREYPGGVGTPDNTRVESIVRGTRRHVWGNNKLSNELPLGEMQYDVSCVYRSGWPPIITDDLLHVHVETVPLRHDGTVPPADEVERIISEYDFTPEP